MASNDLIRYDLLVQEALRGVVREVLIEAAREGLPGEHHFYISFSTDFPGVKISSRLRERYPQEMTIILQHQFWDLSVSDHLFEVGLSFSGVPEKLVIPFEALTGFFDPSVQFGLKFDSQAEEAVAPEEKMRSGPAPVGPEHGSDAGAPRPARSRAKADRKTPGSGGEQAGEAETEGEAEQPPERGAAQVVSLDAFRKKS